MLYYPYEHTVTMVKLNQTERESLDPSPVSVCVSWMVSGAFIHHMEAKLEAI